MTGTPYLYETLEKLGEAEVRAALLRGNYGSKGPNREVVDLWLANKAAERMERISVEQSATALSAKNAAWIAAIAAIVAAIAAIIAIWPQLSSWLQASPS